MYDVELWQGGGIKLGRRGLRGRKKALELGRREVTEFRRYDSLQERHSLPTEPRHSWTSGFAAGCIVAVYIERKSSTGPAVYIAI